MKLKTITLAITILNKKITYFLLLFSCICQVARAQMHTLIIVNTDTQNVFKKINYVKQFASQQLLTKQLNTVYLSLLNKGYIAASIDSVITDSLKNHTAFLHIGNAYKWVNLTCNLEQQNVVHKLGYGEQFFTKRPFKNNELNVFLQKIITYYENHGYPFALAKLDSVTITNQNIKANLIIEKNILIKLDSLVTIGNGKVSYKFLSRYLGIKNGMPYNEIAYKLASSKLKQLPFVTETKPSYLQLTNKYNKLFLFLDKKNASQFDGIIGMQPNEKGKTIFTGDLKIKLVNNLFKSGETIDLNWRRLQSQTQDLKLNLIYPYIAGLPIGSDYLLKLYKKDTTFIDITNSIGLNYYYTGLNHVKVFYKQRNANLISTAGLQFNTVLPEYADVVTKAYGVGLFFEKLNYKFNPKKGISFNVIGSVGNRVIKRNPKINDIAYQNINLKTSQYQSEATLTSFINVYKNHVLKLSSQFGTVFGSTLYRNELFRIGGLKTLRGFDEESIYASTYVIPTVEYRFLFEQNSNLFLFAESAWYENASNLTYLNDMPIGVGAGINFETKAGIFNLSYALGKQLNSNFDFRIGKIHAGLTALF